MKIERKDLKKYTILIVDDEEEIIDPLKSILKHKFKDVLTALDGEEGLATFLEHKPDLVITDIRMPKMSGLDMAEKIKEEEPLTPIIISSAFNETELLFRAIDIGVCQYLLKPIEVEKLFLVIEHCIKHKFLEDKLELKNRELKNKNRKLTEYKNAIELSSIVSKTDLQGNIIETNRGYEEYLEMPNYLVVGSDVNSFKTKGSQLDFESVISKIKQDGFYKTISEESLKSGKIKYSNLTIIPTYNDDGELSELMHLREDITSVVTRIYTDPLTNYPNRAALSKDVKNCEAPVLAFFNIDSFKELNDFYGNEAGDYVLKSTIELMDKFIETKENSSRVYKLSSDEFAVLIDGDKKEALETFESLHGYLERHLFEYLEYAIEISFSVGFTNETEDILIKTDMALKFAKNNHKTFVDFTDVPDFREVFKDNISWTRKLKLALEEDRLFLQYQPILNIKSQEIDKYECLVRMEEDGEIIPPYKFLDIAYKTRLSKPLTKRVIDKSFEFFKDKDHEFSINLAVSDILDEDMRNYLLNKIDGLNVAKRFIVEILESEEISVYKEVGIFIKALKTRGVRIAVDDFGSGYSNFVHLLNLDIDIIKIDGSIIKTIHEDPNSLAIAKTIVDFARNLNIETIAEFVHCEEVLEHVRALGVNYSQGFHTGAPASELVN